MIPEGYADTTPPTDKKDLDQIAAALRLYCELSGGHYPQTKEFDATAIRDEMIKLSDAAAPADTEAVREKKHEQIDQAMPGLNWIARFLRNRLVSGYRGLKVDPRTRARCCSGGRPFAIATGYSTATCGTRF